MPTDVAISHQPRKSEFVLERDGHRFGHLDYRLTDDNVMTIDYVEVDPSLRGSGMGNRLVDAAVAWADEKHLTVKARCSFARAVLAASRRSRPDSAAGRQ